MKHIINILLVVILLITALAIQDRFFPREVVKTKTVTKRDTVWQDSIVHKQMPAPEPDTITVRDTIIEKVEKPVSAGEYNALAMRYMELYNKHYSSNIYNRTLVDDSTALIRIEDTVRKNKLEQYDFTYKDRTPTYIDNVTTIKNQRKFFAGAQVGARTLQPSVIYKDLNDNLYMAGYNFAGPNEGFRIGLYTSINSLKFW